MSKIIKATDDDSVNFQTQNQLLKGNEFYEEANSLIAELNSLSQNGPQGHKSEIVLMKLAEFGASLVQSSETSLNNLKLKAKVYRALAPEAPARLEDLSIDERLLESIIADINHLT